MNGGFGKSLLLVEGLCIGRYLRGRRKQSLESRYGNESQRGGGYLKQRTDRFGKIARGHHENVLLVFEFVELC
jgi:hypothetical protein